MVGDPQRHRCFKFRVPYPVGALYRRRAATREGSAARFAYSMPLVEGILRFLVLVSLADAAGRSPPQKQLNEWLNCLEKPQLGRLLSTLKELLNFLCESGGPFLSESAALLPRGPAEARDAPTSWEKALDAIIAVRNVFAHEVYWLSETEAKRVLLGLAPSLDHVLDGVAFLAGYHLGYVEDSFPLRDIKAREHIWMPCRGGDERGEPQSLVMAGEVNKNEVALIDPTSDRALVLHPFFVLDTLPETDDPREHLLLISELSRAGKALDGTTKEGPRSRIAAYSRPEGGRRRIIDGLFAGPERESTSMVELGLDDTSKEELSGGEQGRLYGFEQVGRLGAGGMATVWEVNDNLGRRRALKVLHPEHARDAHMRRRFKKEAEALMQLADERIPRVHDYSAKYKPAEGVFPYLVMDLVEGESLGARLARDGAFELRDAVAIVSELLDVLSAVHDGGVIHRDIHPGNVVLSLVGVLPQRLCLVDFGLVLRKDDTRLTRGFLGRAGYVSPEVETEPTAKTDIFGVGMVLFAMLVGRDPGVARERLEDAAPHVPPAVARVYERATARLAKRYAGAREMAADLAAAVATPAPPPEVRKKLIGPTMKGLGPPGDVTAEAPPPPARSRVRERAGRRAADVVATASGDDERMKALFAEGVESLLADLLEADLSEGPNHDREKILAEGMKSILAVVREADRRERPGRAPAKVAAESAPDRSEMIAAFRRTLVEDPRDTRTLLKLGDVLGSQGQHAEAIATYETVGKIYAEQGVPLKAIAVYKQMREIISSRAPQLQAQYAHLLPKLAELYQQLGLTSDALAALDEVATGLQRQQRDAEAIEVFRRIVELDPTNPLPHLRLAEALSRTKDVDGAVAEFKTAAGQLAAIERRDDAIKVLERLLHHKPEPDSARICAELYLARGQSGDGMQALAKLQICFSANPRDFETLSLLARAFDAIGQKGKAIEVQKEMARVARDAGNMDLFREVVERLVRIAPQDEGVRKLSTTPWPAGSA